VFTELVNSRIVGDPEVVQMGIMRDQYREVGLCLPVQSAIVVGQRANRRLSG